MLYLVICLVAFSASLLTFFSGFGLGTLLLPAFLFFFSPTEAILMTALVHLVNSIFKAGLLFKYFNRSILFSFGITALLGAILGAKSWVLFKSQDSFYTVYGQSISLLSFIVGLLMMAFALFELVPAFAHFKMKKKAFFIGGFISGFFGGLSGHQGAFRSMFLIKGGLSNMQFVATGSAIALMVDLVRIPIYISNSTGIWNNGSLNAILVGCCSAILGVLLGRRWLIKLKMKWIHILVGIFIFCMGGALLLGRL